MSPGRGDGAHTALRDARLLTIALTEAATGRVPADGTDKPVRESAPTGSRRVSVPYAMPR
ncbi:hypothetical protein [Nonomuraea sp. B19D2]|uniref:hypothetical protein n=1 Tax=Nonomuraea sp. B19D2 TaxID=3159561 RepID=UPI0032DBCF9B